jgi:hypothetical protein
MIVGFEKGDYWCWYTNDNHWGYFSSGKSNAGKWLPKDNTVGASGGVKNGPSVWHQGWYGIRVANKAIENIDMMQGTQEERNLILGQAYFFRAYFHFAIMTAWGGIPYVDHAFTADEMLRAPRLSYRECAGRVTADLEKAAELLPEDWDNIEAGQLTIGSNRGRLVKGTCYGILGKNLLFAASPLMNGMETGTYDYDTELCKKAAVAFNKLFDIANRTGYYALLSWSDYHKNFWTLEGKIGGESLIGPENVFSNPMYQNCRWDYGEAAWQRFGAAATYCCAPTVELVREFGMKNGLPVHGTSPADTLGCGWNPNDPWKNRDPRFYYNIICDRDTVVVTAAARAAMEATGSLADAFANLYEGGKDKNGAGRQTWMTGYGQKKFYGTGCNNKDALWNNNYYRMIPKLRLAHAYIMYAEAVNEAYGPKVAPSDIPGGISAEAAINIVRSRAEMPDVDTRFTVNKDKFRQAIRNETAAETCFEGHQWYDYRRWYIAHLPEYRTKSQLEFDEVHTYYEEKLILTMVFEEKHYWLPFAKNLVLIYPEFYQNPGW